MYTENVQALFCVSNSVALHWDGSTHDGHDVQVGCAVLPRQANSSQNVAALLTPVASFLFDVEFR